MWARMLGCRNASYRALEFTYRTFERIVLPAVISVVLVVVLLDIVLGVRLAVWLRSWFAS